MVTKILRRLKQVSINTMLNPIHTGYLIDVLGGPMGNMKITLELLFNLQNIQRKVVDRF